MLQSLCRDNGLSQGPLFKLTPSSNKPASVKPYKHIAMFQISACFFSASHFSNWFNTMACWLKNLLCQVGEYLNTDQKSLYRSAPWGHFWGHFWSITTAKISQGYYSIDTYILTGSPRPVMTHGTTTVETTQNDTWKIWNLMTGEAFITLPNSCGMYLHFENTDTHEKGFHHSPASALLYTPMVMIWITFITSGISQL